MSIRSLVRLPAALLALLSIAPLARCECYVAAYGLIGKQSGWVACSGTATSSGGAESCCLPGSECGEDSICHVPASQDPGNNAWYVAGCTDSSYGDSVCNNVCVSYATTYIQYDDTSQDWMCCGNGGCNGTVTDDTFSGPSPEDWKVITGSAPSSSVATSPASAMSTSSVASTHSNPDPASTTSFSSNAVAPSSNAVTSKGATQTTRTAAINSGDFKPSPLRGSGTAGASATPGADSSRSSPNNHGNNDGGLTTGAKAGIGVAIGVAALALIVGLVAIFMLRRNRKSKETKMETDEVRMKHDHAPSYSTYAPPYSSSDAYGGSTVSELPTNPPVFEVGGVENEVRHKYWRPW